MRFDGLRETLLRSGIAPRHIRRYLTELSEHLDDLTAEQRVAGYDREDAAIRARARLGSDQELAAAMLARREFRSWTTRAPLAVFGLLPVLCALVTSMVPIGCLVLLSKHFGFMGHGVHWPEWFRLLAVVTVRSLNLLVLPLTAIFFTALAKRQRISMVWPLIGCAVLMLVFVHSDVRFNAPGHPGVLALGIGPVFLPATWRFILAIWPSVAAQYVLTLFAVLWLYRPDRRAG